MANAIEPMFLFAYSGAIRMANVIKPRCCSAYSASIRMANAIKPKCFCLFGLSPDGKCNKTNVVLLHIRAFSWMANARKTCFSSGWQT